MPQPWEQIMLTNQYKSHLLPDLWYVGIDNDRCITGQVRSLHIIMQAEMGKGGSLQYDEGPIVTLHSCDM